MGIDVNDFITLLEIEIKKNGDGPLTKKGFLEMLKKVKVQYEVTENFNNCLLDPNYKLKFRDTRK